MISFHNSPRKAPFPNLCSPPPPPPPPLIKKLSKTWRYPQSLSCLQFLSSLLYSIYFLPLVSISDISILLYSLYSAFCDSTSDDLLWLVTGLYFLPLVSVGGASSDSTQALPWNPQRSANRFHGCKYMYSVCKKIWIWYTFSVSIH